MDGGTAVLAASPSYFHLNSSSMLPVSKSPTQALPFPFEAASIDLHPVFQTASSSSQQRKPDAASDHSRAFLRHNVADYGAISGSRNSRASIVSSEQASENFPASVDRNEIQVSDSILPSSAINPSTSHVELSPPLSPLRMSSISPSLSTPFLVQSLDPSPLPSPLAISPTSSAFVSAYASPFLSPYSSTCSNSFVTPPSELLNPISLASDQDSEYYHQSNGYQISRLTQLQSLERNLDQKNARHPSELQPAVKNFENAEESRKRQSLQTMDRESAAYSEDMLNEIARPGSAPSLSPPRQSTHEILQKRSDSTSNWPRNYDVFIGMSGQNAFLLRFCKWLQAELELQSIACFTADRSHYSDSHSHDIARYTMHKATFGVVVVSRKTFRNPWSIEEIRLFSEKNNLVPIFFDLTSSDCVAADIIHKRSSIWENDGGELWKIYDGGEEEWRETVDDIGKATDWGLQACNGGSRDCILKAVKLLAMKLGRSSPVRDDAGAGKESMADQEMRFARNTIFTGRQKELRFLENILFARIDEEAGEDDRDVLISGNLPTHRESDAERSEDVEESSALPALAARNESGVTRESKAMRGRGRGKQPKNKIHRRRGGHSHEKNKPAGEKNPSSSSYGAVACITGISGIGKTDLALEYAYRKAQQYRSILWIAGDARYLRQNYVHLSSSLNIKVMAESEAGSENAQVRNFDDRETEAMERVKRELSRDLPYLLIIDNLETERDWWDGREISDLLPAAGGASHVIITTRLSTLPFPSLELSVIARTEALSLMKADGGDYPPGEEAALQQIDDKLGRHTLGLWIVRRILTEALLLPSQLLENLTTKSNMPAEDNAGTIFEIFPYLLKLLHLCFDQLDRVDGPKKHVTKMAMVAGWLAPLPISLELLSVAANKFHSNSTGMQIWRNAALQLVSCGCLGCGSNAAAGGELLAKLGLAKKTSRDGWVQIHEIVLVYVRKRATSIAAAKAAVQGVGKRGLLPMESWGHAWAASFVLLGFGAADSVTIELKTGDLISFIEKVALPLALHSFASLSFCHASVELLHRCTRKLEQIEQSFSGKIHEGCSRRLCWSCWKGRLYPENLLGDLIWQDVTLLKALLLETQAKLLLKGGQFDAGEEVCRTCISIRTVMLGEKHPDTLAAQEILAKLIVLRSSS